jgi:hypothetical protein
MTIIKQWEGKFQKGVTENLVKDYEQSLPIGSFAELVLHVSGPNWSSIRQKMADNIEKSLIDEDYIPWPDNKRIVSCSLINPTIIIRWMVTKSDGEYHADFRMDDFRTGVALAAPPVFVIWIIVGILTALFAAFAIHYFKMKAQNKAGGLIGGSSSSLISAFGVAAVAGYFVYLYWLKRMRKKE